MLSLANWKDEITRALASKTSDVTEDGRRKTIGGAESLPTTLSNARSARSLNPVAEEEESTGALMATLSRALSVRTVRPRDVPSGVDTARSSMATLIAALELPNSASSRMSFRQSADFSGPDAESTPRDSRHTDTQATHTVHAITNDRPASVTRRSSIVYNKSDENTPNPGPAQQRLMGRAPGSRQVVPKANRRYAAKDRAGSTDSTGSAGSPGLRRLSLLQQRDMNAQPSVSQEQRSGGIKPLNLAKKQKQGENAFGTRALMMTPKQLARSATSKARGLLRKDEALPDVVVRPPSVSDHEVLTTDYR